MQGVNGPTLPADYCVIIAPLFQWLAPSSIAAL